MIHNNQYQSLLKAGYNIFPGYYNFVHYFPTLQCLPAYDESKIKFQRNNNKISLYIHIPFCSSSCLFCFYKKRINPEVLLISNYLKAIEAEALMYNKNKYIDKIKTIYIGGGSPSFLSVEEINFLFKIIFKSFDVSEVEEITFEVEPETINPNKLRCLKDNGVTRISIGLQSFNNSILKYYRRKHTAEDALNAIKQIEKFNFKTFNIDLMFGLLNQTIEDVNGSIEIIKKLHPPSITYYQLWYASPIKIDNLSWEDKTVSLELIFKMRNVINNSLLELGYTINNQTWYVKEDKDQCKHYNFTWRNNSFLGLGASAYSYIEDKSFWNYSNINDYIKKTKKGEFPIQYAKNISSTENATRNFLLGLKTEDGINIDAIQKKYKVFLKKDTLASINSLIKSGYMLKKQNKIIFSNQGIIWGDAILSKFMEKDIFYE